MLSPTVGGTTMIRERGDLTRTGWLDAGQSLLREEGLRALRLRTLAGALDISTGSFYHHFKDFETFLGQLAEYYSGEQLSKNLAEIRRRAKSPYDCIITASEFALDEELPRLSLAMRAWARSDPRAKKAVQALDQKLTDFFTECLVNMGFSQLEAVTRAYLLVAAGTCDMELPKALKRDKTLRRRLIAIICEGRIPEKA